MITKILAAVALAAAIIAGLAIWRYDAALGREATAKAALSVALEANESMAKEAKRLAAAAEAESQRAQIRLQERDHMAAQVEVLRGKLGDSLKNCKLPDDQLRAIDEFLKGGNPK